MACVSLIDFFFPPHNIFETLDLSVIGIENFPKFGKRNCQLSNSNPKLPLNIFGYISIFFDNGGGGIRKIQPQNMDPKCVSECQGENKQEIGAKIMLGHWPH
jgi:hypothetical protein